MMLIGILALVALAVAVYNRCGWPVLGPGPQQGTAPGTVSILIPARNESLNLTGCLRAALAQGSAVREILVYDDHSTDDTAGILRAQAAAHPLIRAVPPRPLPEGWLGKTYACSQLADAAAGEWLLFIDADARLEPGAAATLVRAARERDWTLLAAWPGLEMKSFWEKVLMPLLNLVVFTSFPAPLALRDRRPSLGLAHGACLLVHRREYLRLGGHGVVRREFFEDTLLARTWRHRGEAGGCLDGQRVMKVRMYHHFSEIWHGFAKITRTSFRSVFSFWLFWAVHAAVFLVPFIVLAAHAAGGRLHLWAGIACGVVLLIRLLQSLQFRYPVWAILLHPLAEILLLGLVLQTGLRHRQGVAWKGRVYARST